MARERALQPLLLCWQGRWAGLGGGPLAWRLNGLAGLVLMALLAGLPLVTRQGLALLMLASAVLWALMALTQPPHPAQAVGRWLLLLLAVAVVATGFSPVPAAALEGLIKLISFLLCFALMRELLWREPPWWDRLVAALLGGALLNGVVAIRQLYMPLEELARWADPNSVSAGTVRLYGTLGNPNLLAGSLVPILPLAVVAALRWRSPWSRLFAVVTAAIGGTALVLTYSRGGWIGLMASLAALVLLLALRAARHLPPLWRRLLPVLLLIGGSLATVVLVASVEPLRIRATSLMAGRGDSSNNFRINVWLAALAMVRDRPWIGIGPGNEAFNLIYPLYQQPRFDALSAYSVPLELLVEGGVPMLMSAVGLLVATTGRALRQLRGEARVALPCIGALAAIAGLVGHGLGDTVFFRPEVQLVGWFSLATIASLPASGGGADRQLPAEEPA
ncbi:putative bicarbonate transporter, IctB family [Synechococcus sp. RSCCF101]|uniref:IctB family putative bicarbonate transporter n=1 Tax=Synechococcus sp. RSCCF101 TaxID=2511069 RepID=UPI001243A961|nr:IctB family putative bicarbonate transporter [Synechococcus sp. RSCCF101]QEY32254.1 putative bicarbonate transporter, IctB family [Synechococcus sp. RSCCF101]